MLIYVLSLSLDCIYLHLLPSLVYLFDAVWLALTYIPRSLPCDGLIYTWLAQSISFLHSTLPTLWWIQIHSRPCHRVYRKRHWTLVPGTGITTVAAKTAGPSRNLDRERLDQRCCSPCIAIVQLIPLRLETSAKPPCSSERWVWCLVKQRQNSVKIGGVPIFCSVLHIIADTNIYQTSTVPSAAAFLAS